MSKATRCTSALQVPCVGCLTQYNGVQVVANFGSSSFKADVQSLEADALQCMHQQVAHTALEFVPQVRS